MFETHLSLCITQNQQTFNVYIDFKENRKTYPQNLAFSSQPESLSKHPENFCFLLLIVHYGFVAYPFLCKVVLAAGG